jgi:AraC-like DNA-binding protein
LVAAHALRVARLSKVRTQELRRLCPLFADRAQEASRQGISPIYVRKLFEGEDTSFTQFVLGERLARAHRLLSDPLFAKYTVAALAFEAGFGDLSYFNRTFRRRYGAAPSAVRTRARLR